MHLKCSFSRMEDISMLRHRVLIRLSLILTLTACIMMTGCNVDGRSVTINKYTFQFVTGAHEDYVIRGGEFSLTAGQMRLLLSGVRDGYEAALTSNIWDMQLDDVSFGEYVDDTVLDMSVRLMIVNMLAADKRIELGTAELSDSMESADAFYDEHEPELTYVSRDEVETLFEMMRLSDKVYNELGKNVDTEISMDEARVIRIQYIYSKDSMQKLYDAAAEYEEGAAFSSLAAKYSDSAEYTAEIGRGEMDKNFENTAFNLDEGQISSVISCNNGFYLIYCVNDNVEDKIDSQKERIVQNRQKEQFENFFNEFSKNVVLSFDKNAWDRITAQLKQGEQ